ncbi:putative ribonuclease H protein [Vitis vinifera]|uniref:Putative ribonuclease H protein n=1 Tax=Vitis vinifera TaxID=29760 RepID=A0A438H742_VITVI|nr:putative ribonuclease H protein [Vitis vinifera]
MFFGVVHNLGVGRFLERGVVNGRGTTGGNYEDGFVWAFTGVYGPISKRYRESFWEELGLSKDCGMTPSALEGILMCQDVGRVRSGPSPFRFENMWLKKEGFKDLLKDWWHGLNFKGSGSFILATKLKALKAWEICKKPELYLFGVGPKKRDVEDLRDYRLISLVGGLYKLLANRLKQVVGMEALSCLIKRAISRGFLTGCRVKGKGGEGVQLTHLLYADDTLIFYDAFEDQLAHLSWVLMWFEVIFGLKINLDKSEIIPVGKVENLEVLALELGCKVGKLSSVYLGLPLGAPHKSVAVCDGVKERLRRRLALWKRQYISKGGRLTLIRSTLSNMPIYYMSILCMLRSIRLRLEQIQRDFLWVGGALERKIHLVKWPVVCSDKSKGGLGVKCLSTLNRAFLGKWSWHFMVENEALWYQVISRKYGVEEGGWYTRKVERVLVWGSGRRLERKVLG